MLVVCFVVHVVRLGIRVIHRIILVIRLNAFGIYLIIPIVCLILSWSFTSFSWSVIHLVILIATAAAIIVIAATAAGIVIITAGAAGVIVVTGSAAAVIAVAAAAGV